MIMNHKKKRKEKGMKEITTRDAFTESIENTDAFFTTHGMKRMKKRNGWGKKASARMLRKIIDEGEDMSEITGYLGVWARAKLKIRNAGRKFVLYGTQVYVFTNDPSTGSLILVTVFPIPSRQQAFNKSMGSRRRNIIGH